VDSTVFAGSGVASLRERFGEYLRGVMSYTSTGKVKIHDVREDISQARSLLVQENWTKELLIEVSSRGVQEENFDLGSLLCTTRYFKNATVLNFLINDERGVVVSFEPENITIDRQLLSWCRKQLTVPNP
jgi:hypothetical protein